MSNDALVLQVVYPEKPLEFAKRVASAAAKAGRRAAVGVTEGAAGSVVLAVPPTAGIHAGNLLREALTAQGLRGGGSAELAQGVCGAEQVPGLVSLLAETLASGVR